MINKVTLIGNVGSGPDVRTLTSGAKVAKVQIATTERTKDKSTNTTTERTEWHSVIMWNKLAELAEKYIKKGAQIYVEGSIHYRKFTDQNGVEKYATDITANEFKLLGRRSDNQAQADAPTPQTQAAAQQPAPAPAPASAHDDVDDLPF